MHPEGSLITFQQQQLLIQIFLPSFFNALEHALVQFLRLPEPTQLGMLLILLHLALMEDHKSKLVFLIEVPNDLQLLRRGLYLLQALLEHQLNCIRE